MATVTILIIGILFTSVILYSIYQITHINNQTKLH